MQTGTNFSENFQTIYEDDPSFLETMVNDYPASPLSLFLLLQHYKSSGDSRYAGLAKKASLYFQNSSWLNYQLSGDALMKIIQKGPDKEEVIPGLPEAEEESLPIENEEEFQPENEIQNGTTSSPENKVEQEAIHEMEQEEKVEFVQGEEIRDFEESFVENDAKEEPVQEEVLNEEDKIEVDHENTPIHEQEVLNEVEIVEEDHAAEEEKEENKDIHPDINTQEETISPLPIPEVSAEHESSVPDDAASEEIASGNEVESLPESTNTSLGTPIQDEEIQELEFEPLHTIDYFASQGIIIREEALMDDKLGKQVKSFTDWLKSMKKLHPGKLPEQNEVVERIIQSSAELSNEDAGILTESMAEVLLKQGKKQKAIEMFEKLSLMNPSKSTYFAAKIESLKNK